MAKRKTTNGSESANKHHNKAARAATQRAAFHEIYELEMEIERLTATHIKGLKERRTELWRTLKADTNITQKVLKANYAPYKLARQAQEDEENGDKTLDDLKESFEALHEGATLDWIEAINSTMPDQQSLNTRQ